MADGLRADGPESRTLAYAATTVVTVSDRRKK
jgi:hypothetical protein